MNRKKLLKLESELRALEMNIEFCGDLNKERDYEKDDFIKCTNVIYNIASIETLLFFFCSNSYLKYKCNIQYSKY